MLVNNYIYMAFKLTVEPDEEEAANKKAEEARAAFGENVQTHWQEEFLPEIQDYIER